MKLIRWLYANWSLRFHCVNRVCRRGFVATYFCCPLFYGKLCIIYYGNYCVICNIFVVLCDECA